MRTDSAGVQIPETAPEIEQQRQAISDHTMLDGNLVGYVGDGVWAVEEQHMETTEYVIMDGEIVGLNRHHMLDGSVARTTRVDPEG